MKPGAKILFECDFDGMIKPARVYSALRPVLEHPAVVIEAMLQSKLEASTYQCETVYTLCSLYRAHDSLSPQFVVGGTGMLTVQFQRMASLERPIGFTMRVDWPLGRSECARILRQLDRKLQTLLARMKPRLVADAKREQKRNQQDPERLLQNAIKRGDSAFDL